MPSQFEQAAHSDIPHSKSLPHTLVPGARHGQEYAEQVTTFLILHLYDPNLSATDSELRLSSGAESPPAFGERVWEALVSLAQADSRTPRSTWGTAG